ncbi:hypothetical protein F5I97DRAFT_1894228 [Phlebopus sp. FC_14]|nr:hypothetical protein F5I97DRAFT_1894228 [Phlebopus sp. FC_14]
MGSLCSKPNAHSGSHQVLGGALLDGQEHAPDPRLAAAEAAERRLKSQHARGTHPSNPKRGRLAAQIEASKSARPVPASRQEEQLVVSAPILTSLLPLFINFIAVGLNGPFVCASPTTVMAHLNCPHPWPSGFPVRRGA